MVDRERDGKGNCEEVGDHLSRWKGSRGLSLSYALDNSI
jgi:hypothetical protein